MTAAAIREIEQWPEDSQYLRPGLDDPKELRELIDNSLSYTNEISPWLLSCTTVQGNAVSTEHVAPTSLEQHEHFRHDFHQASLVVMHVRFARSYLPTKTMCHLSLDERSWWYLLRRMDIMPMFIKLLLDNNGGSLAQVTYKHVKSASPMVDQAQHVSGAEEAYTPTLTADKDVAALHLAYRLGMSAEQELAVYVRADFQRGRTVMLVMGHGSVLQTDRLVNLLQQNAQASWISVLAMLFARRFDLIEETRWKVDFRTQQHEAITGYAAFGDAMKVVQAKDLEFDRDLYITTDMCRDVAYGSRRLLLNCEAFVSHLARYRTLICKCAHPHSPSLAQLQNEEETCATTIQQLKHQLDQVTDLRARLAVQADVKKTLINQRDMQLTLEISQATKRDSELMRGIAAVTMIFLPATFVATFFSMVFFHVDDGDVSTLLVNSNIWLYPVVTIPMTLGISSWYLAWSIGRLPQLFNRKAKRRSADAKDMI